MSCLLGPPGGGLPLTFFSGLLWAYGFGEEDHRGELTFSSLHVKDPLSTPLMRSMSTLVTWRLLTLFSRPLPPSLLKDFPRSTASQRRETQAPLFITKQAKKSTQHTWPGELLLGWTGYLIGSLKSLGVLHGALGDTHRSAYSRRTTAQA